MSRAKKLPSGSWRAQVVTGYEIRDGKRKILRKSFTARTRREAELLADLWETDHKEKQEITVGSAIDKYIELKENALSPSTVRGYKAVRKTRYETIEGTPISALDSPSLQVWISEMAGEIKPKSVRNAYALLLSSVKMFRPDFDPTVTLPKNIRKRYPLPEDSDIQTVMDYAEKRNMTDLLLALHLARDCGLRRSEIVALTDQDLQDGMLTIDKAIVMTTDNEMIEKSTKTGSSTRRIPVPDVVIDLSAGRTGRLIDLKPQTLSHRLERAVAETKVPPFTFHSLRHKFASEAMLSGIPDIYIEAIGGWRHGSTVLKTVYQNATEAEAARQLRKLWEAGCSHDSSHEEPASSSHEPVSAP